jgi:SAM-dependent MidA family methyltransferase
MAGVEEDLGARLRRRIEEHGPITFAAFMEAALYDPEGGFFERADGAREVVGTRGDFVTSPHVSPLFGRLLARLAEEIRTTLGDPPVFSILDVGAGDGRLAADLAAGIRQPERTELILVERTGAHRTALAGIAAGLPCRTRIVATVSDLDPGGAVGVLLANELLDNLPFHRVRRDPDGARELFVGLAGGGLALVEGPPSSPEVAGAAGRLAPGEDGIHPAGALAFLAEATAVLDRGYLVLIDYAERDGAADVHGYAGQRPVADVLARPGHTDVTAGVDFDLLADHAPALGLRSWGTVSQRDLLLGLGIVDETDRLRDLQAELLNGGQGLEAASLFSARNRAGLLVDPAGLGGFQVLCLGKDVPEPPAAWASPLAGERG